MKNAKAKNNKILSVHSRRPYFCNNFPDCDIVPAVVCNSSRVPSTLADEATNVSSVTALFCVVSDKWRDIANIFSVTLSCCDTKLERLCFVAFLCLNSVCGLVNSSSLSIFSISNLVDMFALRNAWRVLWQNRILKFIIRRNYLGIAHLESCSRCNSTSLAIFGSPSSLAQLSNCEIYFRSADNFARPASFKLSNSLKLPRNPIISWK